MSPALTRLLTKWAAQEVTARPPVEPQVVASFEDRYGVRLPADFREYPSLCDGMTEGEMDRDLFSFWALSRIQPVPDEFPEPEYRAYREFSGAASFFCFADVFIYADVFCIELLPDPSAPNRIIGLGPRYLPFASFTEFVEAYLAAPDDLMGRD